MTFRTLAVTTVCTAAMAIAQIGAAPPANAQSLGTDDSNPVVTIAPITGTTIRDTVPTSAVSATSPTAPPPTNATPRVPTTVVQSTPTTVAADPSATAATGAVNVDASSTTVAAQTTDETQPIVAVGGVQIERESNAMSNWIIGVVGLLAAVGAGTFAWLRLKRN